VTEERVLSLEAEDDRVLPFAVEPLDLRGRVVRLGAAVDTILSHYDYPAPVARVLGEGVALTALLGSMLEMHGRFQLQTRSDGAVDLLIVDYDPPGRLRGFVRYDRDRLDASDMTHRLLGQGHLALTIESKEDGSRHQGVVELKEGLALAAHEYFRQSEQIPSFIKLAVAEEVTPQGRKWRAGGVVVQFLPRNAGAAHLDPDALPDTWREGLALAQTIDDLELVDPSLSPERLLFRLFHERGVTVFQQRALVAQCRCSAERIENMLRSFPREDRVNMIGDDGRIGVTCEFCGTYRSFDPAELN
jgi:molecular chaperone Hsp33